MAGRHWVGDPIMSDTMSHRREQMRQHPHKLTTPHTHTRPPPFYAAKRSPPKPSLQRLIAFYFDMLTHDVSDGPPKK